MGSNQEITTVTVTPYDTAWPRRFADLARRIAPVFGTALRALEHIGSTSVPGLAAKPVIDCLGEVASVEVVDQEAAPRLAVLGFVAMGEYGLPGRRYFHLEEACIRICHLHVWESGHPSLFRHRAVRDYLRAHPDEAAAYAALKLDLAVRHAANSHAYSAAKGPFVSALEQRAIAWAEARVNGG